MTAADALPVKVVAALIVAASSSRFPPLASRSTEPAVPVALELSSDSFPPAFTVALWAAVSVEAVMLASPVEVALIDPVPWAVIDEPPSVSVPSPAVTVTLPAVAFSADWLISDTLPSGASTVTDDPVTVELVICIAGVVVPSAPEAVSVSAAVADSFEARTDTCTPLPVIVPLAGVDVPAVTVAPFTDQAPGGRGERHGGARAQRRRAEPDVLRARGGDRPGRARDGSAWVETVPPRITVPPPGIETVTLVADSVTFPPAVSVGESSTTLPPVACRSTDPRRRGCIVTSVNSTDPARAVTSIVPLAPLTFSDEPDCPALIVTPALAVTDTVVAPWSDAPLIVTDSAGLVPELGPAVTFTAPCVAFRPTPR